MLSQPSPLLQLDTRQLLTQPAHTLAPLREAVLACTTSGRCDCVVAWWAYQLAPQVSLDYRPEEMQVGEVVYEV